MKSSDTVRYLDYYEAVVLHIMLMRRLGERNFGVADRPLIESALAGLITRRTWRTPI